MSWNKQLDKCRGSRPRCVLFMHGEREEVAERLTTLVDLPDVIVSANDRWMPRGKPVQKDDGSWDKTRAGESKLRKSDELIPVETQKQLQDWWLAVQRGRPNTPNWDIASTCSFDSKQGLILVEAKAHTQELDTNGKLLKPDASQNSKKNHGQIRKAIDEANRSLQAKTKSAWNISRDSHYQLSNRFAWSWKLASLGVPIVLVYLGFLNACDMYSPSTTLFNSKTEWERVLKNYSKNTVDNACWGETLDIKGTPFIPLTRAYDQPFDLKNLNQC